MGWFGSSSKKKKQEQQQQDATPPVQSKIDPKAAQSVTTLTGCTIDEAIALLRQTSGDVSAAVNMHLDANPPKAEAQSFNLDTEEVKEDLKALSVKELKKFVLAAQWTLDNKSITEKEELVEYALAAATATGKLPPKRPAPKPPPAPEPRLVNFEDQEDAAPAAALRNYVAGTNKARTPTPTPTCSGAFPLSQAHPAPSNPRPVFSGIPGSACPPDQDRDEQHFGSLSSDGGREPKAAREGPTR